MRREWTANERAYLIANARLEAKVLAKALNRSAASVRMAKKRWGAARPDYRGRADRQKFHENYYRGYSDRHIARLMGVSGETVRRLRVSMGKPPNGCDAMSFTAREKRRAKRAKEAAAALVPKRAGDPRENSATEAELNAMIEERMKTLPNWWGREAEKQKRVDAGGGAG